MDSGHCRTVMSATVAITTRVNNRDNRQKGVGTK